MLAAIYYVNVPITSSTHMVMRATRNPAPLVMDIFAVSGWAVLALNLFGNYLSGSRYNLADSNHSADYDTGQHAAELGKKWNECQRDCDRRLQARPGSTSYLWARQRPLLRLALILATFSMIPP